MKSKQETFASLMESFRYKHDMHTAFDDFLTMVLCAFSQNPATGMSYDEDLYMATIARYAKEDALNLFSQLLALLTLEMEDRFDSRSGNDVLGEFYELTFCRKGSGQFFTPFHICDMMGRMIGGNDGEEKTLNILDPSCGSGRMLLAGAKTLGYRHRYYGIDIDHTCVKMTAINLFMNGIFHGEVMCADALSPNGFRMSYVLSFLPFGIFRIQEKEKSRLWQTHKSAFTQKAAQPVSEIILPSKEHAPTGNGSQLQLF